MIDVPLEDLPTRLPELVGRASAQGERVAIRHQGRVVAVLLPYDDFTRFEAMELEDMRLWDKASDAETAVEGWLPLEEVKERLRRARAEGQDDR
jgi:antitoxin (DNA-binding transcriptional repressor) of toxin-antitoxin stability system